MQLISSYLLLLHTSTSSALALSSSGAIGRPLISSSSRCLTRHVASGIRMEESVVNALDDSSWETTDSGLKYRDELVGDGDMPRNGDKVSIHYTGLQPTGEPFDSSRDPAKSGKPLTFEIGGGKIIPGWNEGVSTMKVGGKRMLSIPPNLGFGSIGSPDGKVKPNAKIFIECELVELERGGFKLSELASSLDPKAIALIAILAIPYFLPPGTLPEQIAFIWGK